MYYRTIKFFRDLQDNGHAYHVGDLFPHNGKQVSAKRLEELATGANRRHMPLIEKVEDAEEAGQADAKKAKEPVEGFMNPPEEPQEDKAPVAASKPRKKRGRPKNDAK